MYTIMLINQTDMNELVELARKIIHGKSNKIFKIPFHFGLIVGYLCDFLSLLSRRTFPISSVRIKKFVSNSVFSSSVAETGFRSPESLNDAVVKTLKHEFKAKREI